MHRLKIYSPLKNWKKGEYPVEPFLYLAVGLNHTQDGNVLLSAQLTTKDVDNVVEQMKQELDEFSVCAKQELRRLQNMMRE